MAVIKAFIGKKIKMGCESRNYFPPGRWEYEPRASLLYSSLTLLTHGAIEANKTCNFPTFGLTSLLFSLFHHSGSYTTCPNSTPVPPYQIIAPHFNFVSFLID